MNWTIHSSVSQTTYTPISIWIDPFNTSVNLSSINATSKSWCQNLPQGSNFFSSASSSTMALKTIIALSFILIMVVTVLGNSMVILAVILDRPLRRITSGLIISLAAADILVAMSAEVHTIYLIINGRQVHIHELTCKVSISADLYFSFSELLHLACLATERFVAICYPFQYERIGRIFLVSNIVLAWTIPLAFSFLPVIFLQQHVAQVDLLRCLQSVNKGVCFFSPNQLFSSILFTAMFVVPTSIMLFCHIKIFFVAYSQTKRMNTVSLGSFLKADGSSDGKFTNANTLELASISNISIQRDSDLNTGQKVDEETTFLGNIAGSGQSKMSPICHSSHKFKGIIVREKMSTMEYAKKKMKAAKLKYNSAKQNNIDDFKAARSIGLLCLFFLITWTPYWTAVLLLPFVGYRNIPGSVMGFALWLNFLGTALNPFIYYFSHNAVKQGILRVFNRILSHATKLLSCSSEKTDTIQCSVDRNVSGMSENLRCSSVVG